MEKLDAFVALLNNALGTLDGKTIPGDKDMLETYKRRISSFSHEIKISSPKTKEEEDLLIRDFLRSLLITDAKGKASLERLFSYPEFRNTWEKISPDFSSDPYVTAALTNLIAEKKSQDEELRNELVNLLRIVKNDLDFEFTNSVSHAKWVVSLYNFSRINSKTEDILKGLNTLIRDEKDVVESLCANPESPFKEALWNICRSPILGVVNLSELREIIDKKRAVEEQVNRTARTEVTTKADSLKAKKIEKRWVKEDVKKIQEAKKSEMPEEKVKDSARKEGALKMFEAEQIKSRQGRPPSPTPGASITAPTPGAPILGKEATQEDISNKARKDRALETFRREQAKSRNPTPGAGPTPGTSTRGLFGNSAAQRNLPPEPGAANTTTTQKRQLPPEPGPANTTTTQKRSRSQDPANPPPPKTPTPK